MPRQICFGNFETISDPHIEAHMQCDDDELEKPLDIRRCGLIE
jgi:hypothetical protein